MLRAGRKTRMWLEIRACHCKLPRPGWWGKDGGDLMDPPFPLRGARMWGSVMLNTQRHGLGDPENHPFTFKAYSAISIISHEEGILL